MAFVRVRPGRSYGIVLGVRRVHGYNPGFMKTEQRKCPIRCKPPPRRETRSRPCAICPLLPFCLLFYINLFRRPVLLLYVSLPPFRPSLIYLSSAVPPSPYINLFRRPVLLPTILSSAVPSFRSPDFRPPEDGRSSPSISDCKKRGLGQSPPISFCNFFSSDTARDRVRRPR